MVRIRMSRMGRTHRPFYRINAVEKRTPRDGQIIENLGWYDPCSKDESKQVSLKEERIRHWLSKGAQPSNTVANILGKAGIMDADKLKVAHQARIKGKVAKQEAERKAAEEAAKIAAEEEAAAKKAAEEEAAKKAAEEKAAAEAAAQAPDENADSGEGESAES